GRFGDVTSAYWAKHANGNNLVTSDGLPIFSNQRNELGKVIGNFNPDAILGLTNNFNFKKVSLRLLVDGRLGGIVLSQIDQDRVFDGALDFTTQYREGGWNLGGVDVAGNPVSAMVSAQQFWQRVSSKRQGIGEFFSYDASNIRVREVSLGYSIPLASGFFIKTARASLVGRNLFWLYRGSSKLDIPGIGKRKMWFDPDFDSGGIQSNFGHIPSTRTIGLNLNLNF
ncbi:MAG: SusC/RagA family TonB-linked outer membrane protein, partial [Sphingobacterium thalpophilum]